MTEALRVLLRTRRKDEEKSLDGCNGFCGEQECKETPAKDCSRVAKQYPCEVIRATGNDSKPYPCQLHGEGDL